MNDWIAIFKTGEHTDSSGRKRNWTTQDLDHAVKSYDARNNEVPLVIGHPETNKPAWGWVEGLKRVGEVLYAKPHQVVKEFAQMIEKGMFKKRSVSFYPDGTLRHVGFLGAQPPAVKGLEDIKFVFDGDFIYYTGLMINEDSKYFIEKGDVSMDELNKLKMELETERKARGKAEADAKEFKEKAATAAANFVEVEKRRKREEIVRFVDDGVGRGVLIPAWKEQGIVNFMLNLDGENAVYEFAEGKKQSSAEWFKGFLQNFAAHPLFKEMARPKDDKKGSEAEYAEDMKLADMIAGT